MKTQRVSTHVLGSLRASVHVYNKGRISFRISALFLLVVLLALHANAATLDYNIKFDHLSIVQGLSQNSVLSIVQDTKGFLWFGTMDGLNRYDGYTFSVYKQDPEKPRSLSSNAIWTLYVDRRGTLWVGTRGGGLNRFDRDTEKFFQYQHDPDDPKSVSHNDVFAIYEDSAGALWIGTANGLNTFHRESGEFTPYHNDPEDPQNLSQKNVYAVYEDHAKIFWVGTSKGLHAYNRETGDVMTYQLDPDDPQSLSHQEVLAIYEDKEQVLWIGTANGLNRFDREKKHFTRYLHSPDDPYSLGHNRVHSIHEDRAGVLWIGTYGGGLDIFDRQTEQFIHYRPNPDNPQSLAGDLVSKIYEDESGVLWIGTQGEGLSFYDRQKIKFRHYQTDPKNPNSLSNNYVRAFYQDTEGILWVGTHGGGLNKFDRKTQQWTHYLADPNTPNTLSHDVVLTVYDDRQDRLWVGTEKGLQQLDRNTEQFSDLITPVPYIKTIYEDQNGMLWLGTAVGLVVFLPESGQFAPYQSDPADPHSLSQNFVLSIHEDRQGIFWIGTLGGGLNRFDIETEEFTHFRANPEDLNSLSHDTVTSIHEDSSGTLWIGTAGGLNKFDRAQQTFMRYTEKYGLANNTIYGILEDRQGKLWLSTNKGLSKFDPKTETFRNYEVKDGLQSNEFNGGAYYKSKDGEMFFGGINGFNAFYPENVQDNPYRPPIVITDFQIFNKTVKIADETSKRKSPLQNVIPETEQMTLSWRDYVFSLEFAALHYSSPEDNQYAYIMEGFEKDWNYVGNRRFATYTNLPGGKYMFKVKGTNSDNVWNEDGVSIAITVTPPPWKTWWAYTLYVLTVIGIFLGYIQYKQMQYKRERAILDRFVPYEYLKFLDKKSILDVQLGDHVSSNSMAVMFSDIRSFTTISETMTPKENFDFVNAYLRRVAPVIRGQDGFIVKFLGDGMMAVFPNGAESGVRAAVEKLTTVKEYNEHREQEGWKPIRIGIGVHTGHMMVGMVGEKARMQGDAFSDNVNLTARLEGLTKYYGVSFLISEDTLKALSNPEQYQIRFLDNVAVKGKELPIKIYEVFDADSQEMFEKKLQTLPDFEEAQRVYFNKQFEEALPLFKKVLDIIPDDLTTQLYVERCETLIKEGIPVDWDGVRKMDKK